jgi:hypothetical protein
VAFVLVGGPARDGGKPNVGLNFDLNCNFDLLKFKFKLCRF